jgi:hypothetical protein
MRQSIKRRIISCDIRRQVINAALIILLSLSFGNIIFYATVCLPMEEIPHHPQRGDFRGKYVSFFSWQETKQNVPLWTEETS